MLSVSAAVIDSVFHFVWTDVRFRESRRGAGGNAPVWDHRLNVRSRRRSV